MLQRTALLFGTTETTNKIRLLKGQLYSKCLMCFPYGIYTEFLLAHIFDTAKFKLDYDIDYPV